MPDLLERIALGRTDLVFDWIAAGGAADESHAGVPLTRWCAYYGDVSGLRFLLQEGAALASLGENLDLNGAAFHGHWQLCHFLIEQGADPNRPLPETLETPLHAALTKFESMRHERAAEVLLAAGADVRAATHPGVETGSFMRDVRTCGETVMHRAAAYGSPVVIRRLLDAGAALDARDANGDSPLAWASRALRAPEVLQLLCFGEHRVRPDHEGLIASLIGRPFA